MGAETAAEAAPLIADKYLGGMILRKEWQPFSDTIDAVEPATGTVLGKVALANAETVSAAAADARAAQVEWAALEPDYRAAVFLRALTIGQTHADEIIEWIVRESGSAKAKAAFELKVSLRAIQLAAAMPHQPQGQVLPSTPDRLSLAKRKPLGVVGVISPFNFPLYLAMRAVAPALAVGNAVLLKPDPRTAICGGIVIARLFELAGLPAGVLQLLPAAPRQARPCATMATWR
nr:aldehyde dehydrogenase family protein [Novosphingobium sp. 9]